MKTGLKLNVTISNARGLKQFKKEEMVLKTGVKLILSLTIILVLFTLSVSSAYAFDWLDWLKHWNISGNYPLSGSTEISSPSSSGSILLRDDWGDYYSFSFTQSPYSGTATSGLFITRIPVYYQEKYSVGFGGVTQTFNAPIINASTTISAVGGGGYITYSPLDKLDLIGMVGTANYTLSAKIGEVKAAFPGDPGYYNGGTFYRPGTPLNCFGSSEYSLFFSLGAKYYLNSWVFIEGGYSQFPGGTISNYKYKLSDIDIQTSSNPQPITISSKSIISLGIGIGL